MLVLGDVANNIWWALVLGAQFHKVERITPGNFGQFRERGLPILYAVLGAADAKDPKKALEGIISTAEDRSQSVSLVYTEAEGSRDLLQHLRCEAPHNAAGRSASFAVLEVGSTDCCPPRHWYANSILVP